MKPAKNILTVNSGGRSITPLGDKGAVVLKLRSPKLTARWNQFINMGCSWDYEDYSPHVTISYNGPKVLPHVPAYDELIILAAEQWKPVVLDWDKKSQRVIVNYFH